MWNLPGPRIEPVSHMLIHCATREVLQWYFMYTYVNTNELSFPSPPSTPPLLIQYGSIFYPGFLGGSDGKESACNAGDPDSIPGLGRLSGEGNGYPIQYSCLENSMDRGAWWALHMPPSFSFGWLAILLKDQSILYARGFFVLFFPLIA